MPIDLTAGIVKKPIDLSAGVVGGKPVENTEMKPRSLPAQAIGGVGKAVSQIVKGLYGTGKAFLAPPEGEEEILASQFAGGLLGKRLIRDPAREMIRKARTSLTPYESVGYSTAAMIPFLGPFAAQFGEEAGESIGREEWLAPIAEGATYAALGRLGPPAAKSAAKTAKKQLLPTPRSVRENWAAGAVDLIKEAESLEFANAKKLYPKLKRVEFDNPKIIQQFPEDSVFPGVKAARKKLIGGEELKQLGIEDLRNARSELQTYLKNKNLTPDEIAAYSGLKKSLTAELRGAYARENQLAGFEYAEKNWSDMMDMYKGPTSPVKNALSAKRSTGEVESGKVIDPLSSGDVAISQLKRMRAFGAPKSLTREAWQIRRAKMLSSPGGVSSGISFTYRVPVVRQALSWLITRPLLYPSLKIRMQKQLSNIPPEYIPRSRQLGPGPIRLGPSSGPAEPVNPSGLPFSPLPSPVRHPAEMSTWEAPGWGGVGAPGYMEMIEAEAAANAARRAQPPTERLALRSSRESQARIREAARERMLRPIYNPAEMSPSEAPGWGGRPGYREMIERDAAEQAARRALPPPLRKPGRGAGESWKRVKQRGLKPMGGE